MSNSRARLVPGKPTPIRTVPEQIDRPEYVWKDTVQEAMGEPVVQSPEVIEAMREASTPMSTCVIMVHTRQRWGIGVLLKVVVRH